MRHGEVHRFRITVHQVETELELDHARQALRRAGAAVEAEELHFAYVTFDVRAGMPRRPLWDRLLAMGCRV